MQLEGLVPSFAEDRNEQLARDGVVVDDQDFHVAGALVMELARIRG